MLHRVLASLTFLLTLSLCVAPDSAHAQTATDGDAMLGLTTLGLTTTLIALAGIGVYASTKGDGDRRADAAVYYLRQHALQVRQDLCLGRGPVLDQLAVELRVTGARRATFVRSLRLRRVMLLALAEPAQLTPERALRFFSMVRKLAPSGPAVRT